MPKALNILPVKSFNAKINMKKDTKIDTVLMEVLS